MGDQRGVGRIMGVLLLLYLAGGFLVFGLLLGPVITVPPGYLVNAAANSFQVSLSVIIGLATGALSLCIAILAAPILRQYSQPMALWLLALAVANFALTAVENTTVLSLLSLSQAYAGAGTADLALFEALRGIVASARNWAHYINLIITGCTVFVLYCALFRFALVPRALAAFGMLAALSQVIAVAMPIFGHPVIFPMIYPLGLSHLALGLWLITKGFTEYRAEPSS